LRSPLIIKGAPFINLTNVWSDKAKEDYGLKDEDFENGKFFITGEVINEYFSSYGFCAFKKSCSL